MIHDAFSAGVEPGGLYSGDEIKVLICYLLMHVSEPLNRDIVSDVVVGGGMANYFETGAGLEELIALHNVEEEEDGTLRLTATGRQAAEALTARIPLSLRERSVSNAHRLLARRRRERENPVTIERYAEGCMVTCTINDAGMPLMSLKLWVADNAQAKLVKERFIDDPSALYKMVLDHLTVSGEENT